MADVLVADVLDALDVERADVIVTSFGGYFALRGALAHPGRIRRLVMIGWTAGAPVSRLPLMLRIGIAPLIGDVVGRLPVSRAGVRAIFRAIGSGPAIDDGRIGPAAIDAYTELLRTTASARNDRSLGRLFFSARTGLDARIVLSADERSRIATPVDWLWGGRDAFAGEAIARGFVEPFPEARLTIIPAAGHAPWLDDLVGTVRFVEEALSGGGQPES